MFFAVEKISKFVVDVDERLEGLVREYGVRCWVVHVVKHRLVVDERRWDGLAMKGRWTNDNRQKTSDKDDALSSSMWQEYYI